MVKSFKRRATNSVYAGSGRKAVRTKRRGPKKRFAGRAGIVRVVNKMLRKRIETKESTQTVADGVQVTHNNFIILDPPSTFMRVTAGGGSDPMNGSGERVGDELTLKNMQIRMMVELNERYSDVTFRFMIIKSAKGDVPTRATLFAGKSDNKMLDTINNERYTIMYQKTFKIVAPNPGTIGAAATVDLLAAGYNDWDPKLSRATKIIKINLPGAKFGKGGLIRYENASSTQVKFYDYVSVLYAYSNFTTLQDVFNVGRVNDYIKTMYYTDA